MAVSRSRHVRLHDLRRVFNLIGEMRDLRAHSILQRQHMMDGLCKLLGARQGFAVWFQNFTTAQHVTATGVVPGGAPDEKSLRRFQQWAQRNRLRADPMVDITARMDGPLAARRQDLVDFETHQSSGVYEAFYDVADVGDTLISFYRLRDPTTASATGLHREGREPGFTARDRAIMSIFVEELRRLHRAGEADVSQQEPTLPPRQQQVLYSLLRGDSASRAATRLALSKRTFDEHAQAIYQKLGTESRYHLMALFNSTHQGPPHGRSSLEVTDEQQAPAPHRHPRRLPHPR